MGGGKGGSPRAPEPIDHAKAQGEFMFGKGFGNYQGITDPRLQQKILSAEAQFRPQYSALELADINTMWEGTEAGAANPAYGKLSAELAGLKAGEKYSSLQGPGSNKALEEAAQKLFPDVKAKKGRKKGRASFSKGSKGFNMFGSLKDEDNSDKRKAYIEAASGGGNRAARIAQLEAQLEQTPQTLDEVKGYKGLLAEASRQSGMLEREMLGLQRADDVSALEEFAPQVVEAYRAADPYSTGLAESQTEMAQDLYQRSQGLNPEQQRIADQQALGMAQRQGRVTDQSAVAGQLLGREQYLSGLRGQAAGMGQQAFGMNRQLAGDLGSTILGRPSSAIGLGQSGVGQSTNLAAGAMGPQLFDPNMGSNLAMQQQANEVSYGGAMAQAGAAKSAGKMALAGTAIAAI